MLALIWGYSTVVSMMPFFGWGGYMTEGGLITCGYDYLSQDSNRKSYLAFAFIFNYLVPLIIISFFYTKVRAFIILILSLLMDISYLSYF